MSEASKTQQYDKSRSSQLEPASIQVSGYQTVPEVHRFAGAVSLTRFGPNLSSRSIHFPAARRIEIYDESCQPVENLTASAAIELLTQKGKTR
jgi:hypothetical protein